MGKKPVLGKGINALIPDYSSASLEVEGSQQIVQIPLEEIEPNPNQARIDFDEVHLEELARSIQEKGVLQPVIVNRVGQTYQLIAGERRWRACKKVGLETIPAIVYEIDSPQEWMELALIENVQRENLNVIEEAEAYRALMNNCYLTQDEVAQKVGKDRSTIANTLRLLHLPLEIQDHLRRGSLQMGHARALLSLEDEEDRLELGRRCLEEKMTVREIERLVKARRLGRDRNPPGPDRERKDPDLIALEERLQHRYGTAVAIHRHPKKGRIEIEFYDDSDLERILALLLEGNG